MLSILNSSLCNTYFSKPLSILLSVSSPLVKMDSVSTQNLKCVAENIEFEEMEVSDVDEALLESFLDESNEEETEDERLGSVMRSLEAEINHEPEMIMGSTASPCSSISIDDYRLDDVEIEEGCSISSGSPPHVDNFDWIISDMEMDSSLVLAPCDDHEMGMNCWYMDTFPTNEIEDLRDCYEYSNSLWQGAY